jgi:signal transduction histidine kinase
MTIADAGRYRGVVSQRLAAERTTLARRWLTRLEELLTVDPRQVFPSDELLDHIPELIAEIARYLRAPADEEIAANSAVIDKARELGMLRHRQRASVHQLLREYEILGEILEDFVADIARDPALEPTTTECLDVFRRLTHSSRTLMRTTLDTFVSEYTATIEERDARITTFNSMASHELRSPVGTLLFAATLLETDAVRSNPERLAKVVATIRSNTERLSWLVTNLQRVVRLDDTLDVPSEQLVDVRTLAGEVARQLEEMAAARGVTILVDPQLPSFVVDPARLELILLNLVSNAIKYSDPSKAKPFVEIASDGVPTHGSCVILVRDNGLGIADDDQPAIFERFFRAHAHLDTSHGIGGTGLGLAIVADCLEALGGSIRCESTVGQGTTFSITLPTGNSATVATAAR